MAVSPLRTLLGLCILAAAGNFCVGAASSPETRSTPGVRPWALADVDGDRQLDRIEAAAFHSAEPRRIVRLEVHAAAGYAPGAVASWMPLRLRPQDVDNDSDLDLIVWDDALGRNVGLWINDGEGGFREADPSVLPALPAGAWRPQPRLGARLNSITERGRRLPSCGCTRAFAEPSEEKRSLLSGRPPRADGRCCCQSQRFRAPPRT